MIPSVGHAPALGRCRCSVRRGLDREELSHDPDFASLRDSERFQALLESLKETSDSPAR